MDNAFKNKNMLVLIFEVLIIALAVSGITFAVSKLINDRTTTLLTATEYNIDYVGDTEVVANNLEPMDDSLVNINTKDNVIRLEFSLRGVSSNKEDDLIYDIMLSEMNVDCSLLNKYTKWNLYKNGSLLSTGSLDPAFDGNVLSDNMRLTNIQEDLPEYNQERDNYVLIFWISEACSNIETCELVDQSGIVNSQMSMKVFVALYSGSKKAFERVPNYDTSCANRPELYNRMIPVTYKNGEWVVANEGNNSSEYLWYDYGNQKWANAVVVKSNKYSKEGTVIDMDDVLAFYVWIPRYKYKLWNVEKEVTDSYNAYDNGIDIIFENGLNMTTLDEYKNNEYLTHPVFSNNLKGFWISKYEISNEEQVKFVSNLQSYRNATLDNYKNISSELVSDYKLGDDVSSHIVNNLEWGATLYLSHSKYGVCQGDGCRTFGMNTSYVAGSNKQDTTTRNVYGVYDMAGGATEYVVGDYQIGNAMNEVMLNTGVSWYNAYSVNSRLEYTMRGGCDKGLFYFGDIGMSSCDYTTRSVLVSK